MGLDEQFESVLAAARNGEDWALAALYRDLHPRLLAYLTARDPVEAEDLASEVWIDVASGLSTFRGDKDSFRRWLFTIASRRVIDLRRSALKRKTRLVPVEAFADRPTMGGPESDVLASEASQAALTLIGSLPHDQAEVVLLRVVVGLSVAEVAEVMGRRPGTIRVLQHRAIKRLAQEMSRET